MFPLPLHFSGTAIANWLCGWGMTAFKLSARHLWRFVLVVLGLATFSSAAFAMRVSPMVLELAPAGTNSAGRIEVQNTLQQSLAFETKVTRIEFDDNGVATEVPADEDFLIFPPQQSLAPGGRQVVRIQYVGDPTVGFSQSYYVSVNQLPVTVADTAPAEGGAAQIQVVYHMKALVVVAPPKAEPNVTAVGATPVTIPPAPDAAADTPPSPGVEVTLRNAGLRHAFMANIGWRFDGQGTDGRPLRVDVAADEMSRLLGTGYVGPNGGQRIFRIPEPAAFGQAPITVSFFR